MKKDGSVKSLLTEQLSLCRIGYFEMFSPIVDQLTARESLSADVTPAVSL